MNFPQSKMLLHYAALVGTYDHLQKKFNTYIASKGSDPYDSIMFSPGAARKPIVQFWWNLVCNISMVIGWCTVSLVDLGQLLISDFHGVPLLDFLLKFMDDPLKIFKGGTPWKSKIKICPRSMKLAVHQPMTKLILHTKFHQNRKIMGLWAAPGLYVMES